ncbi:MAG: DsrE/DsrF-like family protein [Rhodobacterales bacterium]|nr:MAG: DsrE/DsrF-like family protein [Rhodobacterales bacterium]
MTMFKFKTTLAAAAVSLLCSSATFAEDSDALFINLTSDDGFRVTMALAFGGRQMERGHHLTVFLNDRGVMAATKANAALFASQQAKLAKLLESGATVVVCGMCMKQYGIAADDLMEGLTVGNPDLTSTKLFKENTVALSW